MMKNILPATIILLLLAAGCGKKERLSDKNLAEIYTTSSNAPEPDYVVFHRTPSKSEVHYRIDNRSVAYAPSESGKVMAQMKIRWELFENFESKVMTDSSSFVLIDSIGNDGIYELTGMFEINVVSPKKYILKVILTDLNRDLSVISFVQIDKSNEENRQNFKVLLAENNSILFRNYIYPGEKVIIQYNKKEGRKKLFGHYFDHKFPIAPPPFSSYSRRPFDYKTYKPFYLTLDENGQTTFSTDRTGFYHLTFSEESKTGLTLFNYGNEFPEIDRPEEMLATMRFILTKKEYNNYLGYSDKKKAIDEFWLKTAAGDPDKARKLIRTYYNRVENANRFFTSYKEGWKTDRGIIYIVFGPPDVVYRSTNGESWVYGEEKNQRSVNFNFSRVINPFSDNDYILTRSTVYKNPWYRTVDAWRQGRINSSTY